MSKHMELSISKGRRESEVLQPALELVLSDRAQKILVVPAEQRPSSCEVRPSDFRPHRQTAKTRERRRMLTSRTTAGQGRAIGTLDEHQWPFEADAKATGARVQASARRT